MSKNKKGPQPPEIKKEIRNAVIRDVLIGLTDRNIFTCWLVVGLGGQSQGYGGYDLRTNNSAHDFITGVLDIVGTKDIKSLTGKAIRVEHDPTKIYRIGHYIEDKWFDYESTLAFKASQETPKSEEQEKENVNPSEALNS